MTAVRILRLAAGGRKPQREDHARGWYFEPTVLADATTQVSRTTESVTAQR